MRVTAYLIKEKVNVSNSKEKQMIMRTHWNRLLDYSCKCYGSACFSSLFCWLKRVINRDNSDFDKLNSNVSTDLRWKRWKGNWIRLKIHNLIFEFLNGFWHDCAVFVQRCVNNTQLHHKLSNRLILKTTKFKFQWHTHKHQRRTTHVLVNRTNTNYIMTTQIRIFVCQYERIWNKQWLYVCI